MNQRQIPRIMIAATGSGSGKTTITCGLLQAFLNRGKKLASFKCGPDYIDPMFHTEVLGIKSRNLDLFFTGENTIKYLFDKNSKDCDLALIEGVMGYYDGLAGKSTECSSYDLARKTNTPVILVVDCKGMSVSVVALIKGFLEMRQDHNLAGVILNRTSSAMFTILKELIEEELRIKVLGYLPVMTDCQLESRHLGLVTAQEIGNLKEIINKLAVQIESSIDLDSILEIANDTLPLNFERTDELNKVVSLRKGKETIRIAVAMDKVFCFYYQDNLDLLIELGAEIVPFSPLTDQSLPEGAKGLIFGGGYPELYLEALSQNKNMRKEIKKAIEKGIPCFAECGGFMYLHQWVKDRKGISYEMVGAIKGESFPTEKLTRFGYISLEAREDTLLGIEGTQLKGHEFHYWDSTNTGDGFHAQKPLLKSSWDCIIAKGNLLAGYPHIHFYSNIEAAASFLGNCKSFENEY